MITLTRDEVDVAKAWLEALNSGNYTQDKNYLKTTNGYCCWGVLCDLSHDSWLKSVAINYPDDTVGHYFIWGNSEVLPPRMVMREMGLFSPIDIRIPKEWLGDRKANSVGPLVELDRLNDTGWDFGQISNLVERWFNENTNWGEYDTDVSKVQLSDC